jgi:hypothetical protein
MAGASEFGLRLPSVLAGVALVAGAYFAIVRWTACHSAGLLAALLVAVDRNCVFYGQEARTYALVQLVGLLHVGLFVGLLGWPRGNAGGADGTGEPGGFRLPARGLGPEKRRLALRLTWVASGALLFYLHYTAVLLVAAEVVYYVLLCVFSRGTLVGAAGFRCAAAAERPEQRAYGWPQFALDFALLALSFLPAVPHLREIAQRRQNWLSFVPARSLWRIWEIGSLFPLHVYLLVPLAVLAASWAYQRIRWGRQAAAAAGRCPPGRWFLLALCWLLVPLTLAWAATVLGSTPLFFRRYLMVAAVAPILWAALCCAACPSLVWRGACAWLVVAAAVYDGGMVRQWCQDGRVVGDRNQDWRSAAAYVNQHAGAAAPVFVRSGLIEAEHWYSSEDPLRREFCLLPVLGLYRLDHARQTLFPLPISPPAVLSSEARRRVLTCREAWCFVPGSEQSVARFAAALNSAWRRAGVPPSAVQRSSFGDVAVLHVRVAAAKPAVPARGPAAPRPGV